MGIDFAEEVYGPEETSVCLITAFKVEFKAGDYSGGVEFAMRKRKI